MTVEVRMTEKEFMDILDTVPVQPDKTKRREDLAEAVSAKCHIPLDLIHYIVVESPFDFETAVWANDKEAEDDRTDN